LERAGGDRARVVVERRAVGDLAAHRSAVVLAVRALLAETRKDSAIDADESYIPRELAVKTVNYKKTVKNLSKCKSSFLSFEKKI
jgi:hypothetical protein